jgi:transposase
MRTRRRIAGDFKARVVLEALRGDKTIQEIAGKHKVHPNQVSAWKRQAIESLSEVFSNGADRERQDHQAEIRALHAKIGQLTVERDFLSGGLKR